MTSWRGRKSDLATLSDADFKRMNTEGERLIIDLSQPLSVIEQAHRKAVEQGVEAWGWIEVGRDVVAATTHPEWMHAPQHHEWLEAYPNWRTSGGKHPALVYPWVCVNNLEVFDYALKRVVSLVEGAPPLAGVFLNDIQGPPAGCGCGNILCRSWDNSPGEKVALTPYVNPDVFFSKVFWRACADALANLKEKSIFPSNVIPILCGECELEVQIAEAYSPDDALGNCRGIPCAGVCAHSYWPAMVRAFANAEGGPKQVGLLTPYKLMGRDSPIYGGTAAWTGGLVSYYRTFDPNANLIAVVQGWDVNEAELEAQKTVAAKAGAAGVLVLETPLNQSWEPQRPPEGYAPIVPPAMCKHTS